jgi:hypothetical protein
MDGDFDVVVSFVQIADRWIIWRIRVNAILKQGRGGNNKYIYSQRANKVKGDKITQVHLPYCVADEAFFTLLHQQPRLCFSVSTTEITMYVKCTSMCVAAIYSSSKTSTVTNKFIETN